MAEEMPNADERSEPASDRKKEESRKKGQVAKSMELNSALVLIFGLMIIYFSGGMIAQQLSAAAKSFFAHAAEMEITRNTLQNEFARVFAIIGIAVAPLAIGLVLVGLLANFAQVGFLLTFETIRPKWSKLNPLSGIRNILISRRSAVELGKGVVKISLIGLVSYFTLDSILSDSLQLIDADANAVMAFMAKGAFAVGLKASAVMLVLAGFDYAFQRLEYERNLRMTKQEVKEEYKMLEGDPLVKGRIKTIQRQIAYKRMMTDVPKADVVVTNPTHLALALKYDLAKMTAPKVVAKGADLIAQKIKEVAKQNNVPIVEDKPLAQALYKAVDIGDEVPEQLFQAVAQVLAYIYRMRDQHNRTHRR
ncbi:MAG: flagellar biosynthesis protein FlhB [Ignavibacteriales bacterium]|nr:flagellar biosynthesis protein FlhB [Ignavibacteriales bacterium]